MKRSSTSSLKTDSLDHLDHEAHSPLRTLTQSLTGLLQSKHPRPHHHLGGKFIEKLLPSTERPRRSDSAGTGDECGDETDSAEEALRGIAALSAASTPAADADLALEPSPWYQAPAHGGAAVSVGRASCSGASIGSQPSPPATLTSPLLSTPICPPRPSRTSPSASSSRLGSAAFGAAGGARPKIRTCPSRRRTWRSFTGLTELTTRILDRDASFGQSLGHWRIHSLCARNAEVSDAVSDLFLGDWYHAFLDAKISIQLSLFALAFVFWFTVFAALFLLIDEPCGLNLQGSFIKAYLLALETMMTIGYGIPDPYMEGCWQGAIVLTLQTLIQLIITALLIGVIFQGISRPQARACTVLFSERAAIRCLNGAHYLMFRACDLRFRHALIEAHVRLYCVHRHPVHGFTATPMRLDQPDDELGGMVLLTLPSVIIHRIDAWSPLAPPPQRISTGRMSWIDASSSGQVPCGGHEDGGGGAFSDLGPLLTQAGAASAGLPPSQAQKFLDRELFRQPAFPMAEQRQMDADSGNRDGCVCPFCGETFNTVAMLVTHCEYNAHMDELSQLPERLRHRVLLPEELSVIAHRDPSRDDLQRHWARTYLEVVVLVEGIEPTTSSTLQARHSYVVGCGGVTGGDDISWDSEFAECCRIPGDGTKGLGIDLGLFHEMVASPPS